MRAYARAAPSREDRTVRLALAPLVVAFVALLTARPAPAMEEGFPDWQSLADVDVIHVVTEDEDGDARETPVWFVMVDGAPYLRTRDSRWLDNIVRGSPVVVRIEGLEYEVTAEVVEGEAIVEAVNDASAAKYGWQESLLAFGRWFESEPSDILKLVPKR